MAIDDFPIPDFRGRPLTGIEYNTLTPEKLELMEGYLGGDTTDEDGLRKRLLIALFLNEGLLNVVKLVPRVKWREALRQCEEDEQKSV